MIESNNFFKFFCKFKKNPNGDIFRTGILVENVGDTRLEIIGSQNDINPELQDVFLV